MERPALLSLIVHGVYERLQYPMLLALLVGFWLALAGFCGSTAFGFPYLFWHARAEMAICSGLALGAFLGEWCFVSFILDSERPWLRRWAAARGDDQILMRYLFWTNLLFASLFLPTPFFYRIGHEMAQFNLVRAGMSAMAIVTGVTCYVCVANLLSSWVRSDSWGMPWVRRVTGRSLGLLRSHGGGKSGSGCGELGQGEMAMVWVHAVSGLFFAIWLVMLTGAVAVYLLLDHYSVWLEALLSPGVLVCALLKVAVRIYGFLVFHLHRLYFGVVAVGVMSLFAVSYYDWFGHKYDLPGVERQFATADELLDLQQERIEATLKGTLPDTDTEALANWLDRAEVEGRPPILVVVAASGGGIRAQIWTTAVLSSLEQMIPEFPYQTRLITGASGGMVGAGYYVGTLQGRESLSSHGQSDQSLHPEQLVESASMDSLTPTARTLFFRDLPRQLIPALGGRDRGEALEDAWIANTGGEASVFRQPFESLREGEMQGWRPSLVFTPALLEDGKRLMISNLNLSELAVSQLASRQRQKHDDPRVEVAHNYSMSAIEAQLLKEHLDYDMSLATAARLNASFPLISPTVSMPVENVQWSLADASYYDNYGMDVAVRWLHKHRDVLKQWQTEGRLQGILLVQIVSASEPRNQVPDQMPKWTDGWLTPLAGLMVHVMQKTVFSSDEQLEELARQFNTSDETRSNESLFLRHMTISFKGNASLSWYLTPEEVRSLVHPFEQHEDSGQLDFQKNASVEFHSMLERAGQPTEEMEAFRDEIQRQLRGLHHWWRSRSRVQRSRFREDPAWMSRLQSGSTR